MDKIKDFFATKVTLPDFHFKINYPEFSDDVLKVVLIWIIVAFLLLEMRELIKKVPAAPLAPVYLSYRKAGQNGRDSSYKNKPIRKISTRVGSNIFFKDIPILGSRKPFCFDIIYENHQYMICEAGHDPEPLHLDTQFRRGDYNFVLKELIF